MGDGRGAIEIDDAVAGRQTSDTSLQTATMGASGPVMSGGSLIAGGTTTLMLKGQASVARVEVAGLPVAGGSIATSIRSSCGCGVGVVLLRAFSTEDGRDT